jgi:hypothetical protein
MYVETIRLGHPPQTQERGGGVRVVLNGGEGFVRMAVDGGALKPTANPRPGGVRAWRLADELRTTLGAVLPYFARPAEESVRLIERLAREQGSIRNQDVQDLLGVASPRASQLLRRTEADGRIRLAPGAQPTGRGTFYVPAAVAADE